jgi:cysteinyl-tRNA synthetase
MKKHYLLIIGIFLFSLSSFSQRQSLKKIKTWAYQMQGINISQIASDTTFQLIVIDYSSDGTDENKFTPQEIAKIKSSGKKIISYISIGEAENYRFYWDNSWISTPPSCLGPINSGWPGNYKVKFWLPNWQKVIFAYTDTIIKQGFDGIYMDLIDSYYYWMVENPQQPFADTLMIQFVKNIRHHVDSVTGNTNFILIPQNAEEIANSMNVSVAQKAAYFNAVNAIGVEDVFYYGAKNENNAFNPDTFRINQLMQWQANNKQVFSIDYLTQPSLINQYAVGAHSYNFVPYACVRELDQLCGGIPMSLNMQSELDNVMIYPNPSDGKINLYENFAVEKYEIEVFSSFGQPLGKWSVKKRGDVVHIDLSDFPDGIYYLSINSGKGSTYKKIVINH